MTVFPMEDKPKQMSEYSRRELEIKKKQLESKIAYYEGMVEAIEMELQDRPHSNDGV